MAEIKILTESELRQCVALSAELNDVIADAFARLAEPGVVMPPVLSMDLPAVNGEVDIKTAWVPGVDNFAIKVSPGFFDNPAKGLASLNGLMVLLSADTGMVTAVLLDNGYLTDLRTAAAGGVAARYLAPQQVHTAGVIGTGVQARLQVEALLLERSIERLLVWGRDADKAAEYAAEQSRSLKLPVSVADSVEMLVQESQVVITTTPARQPLIRAEWLHPGLHITAMGSDSPLKNEIAPQVLADADILIVDRLSQSLERGELRTAVSTGVLSASIALPELSALCAGQHPGRSAEDQISVCDLTGTGVQDTVIADHALSLALRNGLGTSIHSK
ncbi:cyclodeaminase [Marinobacterium zhoushanense]|uniref:Cyclodeaminase n=1 Tax=Marinobacterium zhoushanense TaxID=1679163 RepID=A0ABQ1KWL2_9GAMM|nr:cyclodeaminase [Marinobacterium zhoushanense]GGC09248.1 cyclodeaminase [Marinobacterium zhoushanense]